MKSNFEYFFQLENLAHVKSSARRQKFTKSTPMKGHAPKVPRKATVLGCRSTKKFIRHCLKIKIEIKFQTNWIVKFMTANEHRSDFRNQKPLQSFNSKTFVAKLHNSSNKSFKFHFASFAPSLFHQKNIPTAIQPTAMKNQSETL